MLTRIFNKIKRVKNQLRTEATVSNPNSTSQRGLLKILQSIPFWEHKINAYKQYEYAENQGIWIKKPINPKDHVDSRSSASKLLVAKKVNYGCGGNLKEGWLNVDLYESSEKNYCYVNLLEKHPFAGNSVKYGFSEDMLEHLNQAESIFFLGEVFRTLELGGLMRLSFPGLEGVLNRHYTPPSEVRLREGEFEAYSFWDHIHFYSKGELEVVAKHVGFSRIEFVQYGESDNLELRNLDTRENQIGLNTYVELTK